VPAAGQPVTDDPALTDGLVDRAALLAERPRAVLGIVGAPGSGKSTLAKGLREAVAARGIRVALVGMDGFHLAHRALGELGLTEVKGAPATFDVSGYVSLLRRLRDPGGADTDTVWAPEFRREIEDAVAAAVPVDPDVRLVVTEGNYLLLDGPWREVRGLLDEAWYLDVPDALRQARLAARHIRFGRTRQQAWARTLGSDEDNAALVRTTLGLADLVISHRSST
jgi:pantothenate kinase